MNESKLIPNLFRAEFSIIVGVLCKTFGISNIQLAEDIASETFLAASESWSLHGTPENPKAWLYAVAKNKCKDHFKRQSVFKEKIEPELLNAYSETSEIDIDLSDKNIKDSQLRMLFNVCNPSLSSASQITLALRVLCGFGITEIATALLASKSTINKRLLRAKDSYKNNSIALELPEETELLEREDNVLTIIYLLFSEGYYSAAIEKNIRKNLCLEAMRLLYLFLDFKNSDKANALMALFCFHASRFEAREDEFGNTILYEDQNVAKWDQELILKGKQYLSISSPSSTPSKYHLQASIAMFHTEAEENEHKWSNILHLYNRLLQIEYSPIVTLNRTYALSKVSGKEKALLEALKIDLKDNHLYHMLLAELYEENDNLKRLTHLQKALKLAHTESEKRLIMLKITSI